MGGLKLIKAEVTNFKNIDHRIVDMDGRSMVIIGKNGAGKSSLIQALMSPLNAKMVPAEPIKDGEERASVELTISGKLHGEETLYRVDMYFTPGNKKGRLVVTNSDGEAIKGATKSIVNSIVGNIGFDMFEFLDMAKTKEGKVSKPGIKKQIDVLKGFMKPEEKDQMHSIETEYKEKYEERTGYNSRIKQLEAFLQNSEYTQEEIDKYSKPIDASKIQQQSSEMAKKISNHDSVLKGIESKEDEIKAKEEDVEDIKNEIKKLQEKLKGKENAISDLKKDIQKGKEWLEKNPKPNPEDIDKQLAEINEHNAKHEEIRSFIEKNNELNDCKDKSNFISNELKELEEQKKKVMSSSSLPVKGLSFDEDQIYYKGLPFVEGQIPTSTLIGIGTKIAMAMNPNLKVLTIHDGSLLDKETLSAVIKMTEKYGYQLLIEIVDQNGGDLDIKFTEEYLLNK